ncbi:MAG: hypothetical protein ACK55Z_21935, partial [bacterium]
MSQPFFSANDAYRFIKVEDYFAKFRKWERLNEVQSHSFDPNRQLLTLDFVKADGKKCFLLLQFFQKDTFRVRFHPGYESPDQYPTENSRAVVMDQAEELRTVLRKDEGFEVLVEEDNEKIVLKTQASDQHLSLRMIV